MKSFILKKLKLIIFSTVRCRNIVKFEIEIQICQQVMLSLSGDHGPMTLRGQLVHAPRMFFARLRWPCLFAFIPFPRWAMWVRVWACDECGQWHCGTGASGSFKGRSHRRQWENMVSTVEHYGHCLSIADCATLPGHPSHSLFATSSLLQRQGGCSPVAFSVTQADSTWVFTIEALLVNTPRLYSHLSANQQRRCSKSVYYETFRIGKSVPITLSLMLVCF